MERRTNPRRQCRREPCETNARLTPAPVSSNRVQSSDDEYFTPPGTASSSEDEPAPSPSLSRRPARRGRPPLPASLESAGHRALPTAPATGGVVRRMRWTSNLNESVMRAYYGATDGGTNLTAYRSRLLALFQELHPDVTVTAQRLSDQVRAIQRLNLLEQPVLERLRLEALPPQPVSNVQVTTPTAACLLPPNLVEQLDLEQIEEVSLNDQYNEQLRRILEETIEEYRLIPMTSRPRIPRLPMHKRNMALMSALDSLLMDKFNSVGDLTELHFILYCGAVAVCRVAGVTFPKNSTASRQAACKPAWQYRIEKRITAARTLIAKLYCFRTGNTRPRVMRYVIQAFAGTGVRQCDYAACVTERIDYFKQKVYAWAKRIRRYRERADRFNQNRLFQNDQKIIYRNWERPQPPTADTTTPDAETMLTFWRNIWSRPVDHVEGQWIGVVGRACEQITQMEPVHVELDDVISAIRSAPNWKSPGPDGLHNFWIKKVRSCHARLATLFQAALEAGSLPDFMTTGVTHLIHKSGRISEPKNYRPITCLPTIYKLLTSIIKFKIVNHVLANNILASNQNGCNARSRGTKDLLLIDMAICQQVRRSKKNISMAWIDYKKAYDSVPHSWLMRVLDLYKIDANLCFFLSSCMRQWNTVLYHPGHSHSFEPSERIWIKRGIFQGDSLSPLWFCLALNPLSILLNDSMPGYRLHRGGKTISHLLYMDDLKLYAPKQSDLMALLKVTETFSSAISMEFGVDKCAVINVQKGRVVNSENLQLSENMVLRSLCESDTYKYLGMSEALGIADSDVKQQLKARFLGRLTKVLKSLLSGGNKVRAFNCWVIPVIAYSFGILRWTQSELDALDRMVRRQLTAFRMHHPRSSVMRLYIPRRCGGRGFLNVKSLHNREVCSLRDYFLRVDDEMHRDVVKVDSGLTALSMAKQNWRRPQVLSISERKAIWKGKELHGRFYSALTGPEIDQLASVSWLRFSNLFGETEGFVFAIMDEVVKTNNYRKYIIKDGTVDICRACHCPGESIRHVVSGCSRLANGEYLHRHNQVAGIIHQQLALRYGIVESEVPYYQYKPEPVLSNNHVTLYWDRSIVTDRTIMANKPDIVVIDRSARRAMLIDITIPHDVNLVKAEHEKISKYLDLSHEVGAMWNMDTTIIVPIVISVHGLMAKSFDQHLQKLSLGSWVKSLIQKAVLLDTARIVRRFLTLDP